MHMHPSGTVLLLLVVAAAAATTTTSQSPALQAPAARHATGAACIPSERDALLAFKRGITRDPAGRLASWKEANQDCCRWSGVRCSNRTGHVIGLRLGNHMYDPLHLSDTALAGQISPSLLSLHHLESLDLSANNLSGPDGRVPEFLGLFKNLRYLDLSAMPLSGMVPPKLGNLSKLHYLDLSALDSYPWPWGYLQLYSMDISWLSNLPLVYLDMGSVDLHEALDWAHVVNTIPSLKVLRLPSCSLTNANQSLPHLNLTHLVELSLSLNNFPHPVASCWFWNLTSLKHLELAGTSLSGQIPDALGAMLSLQALDLSTNNLSGPAGRVPEFLGLLKNLRYLNLSGMPLFGMVPPQLGNLSKLHYLDLSALDTLDRYDSYPSGSPQLYSTDISWLSNLPLVYLDMGSVALYLHEALDWAHVMNTIPSLKVLRLRSCGLTSANQSLPHLNLTHLVELSLSLNNFHHPVASCWFWNLTSLKHLELEGTWLYGQIPRHLMSEIAWLIDLITHSLSEKIKKEKYSLGLHTNFTGPLPSEIGMLRNLVSLDLSHNGFTGPLPSEIGMLQNLVTLDLSYNGFTGPLPSEIGMLRSLVTLDLSYSGFTGPLPSGIGMLRNLVTLDLSYNGFTGPLPSGIGMLSHLTSMDLSYNNLSGVITHEHLDGLSRLTMIDLSYNSMKIEVDPEWLPTFKLHQAYFGSCHLGPSFPSWLQSQTNIDVLDISSASIFDSLPNWFFTTFTNAKVLYISNNGINGTLPTNIENMTSLIALYLDSNQLTGQIPRLLPTWLDVLDISKNSLSGPLPSNFGASGIRYLNLFSNHITGHIPHSICEMKVGELNLADNHLEGEFPQCSEPSVVTTALILSNNMLSGKLDTILEAYIDLSILDLAWNKFTGSIPETICNLEFLIHLNLAGNNISGALLPHHLSNFIYMIASGGDPRQLHIQEINMSVPTKGQERYYFDNALSEMVSIDLSSNHLTGVIPEEISSLDGIVNLNLSRNNLTGKIPERIGVMKSMESLDLSENKLCGEIPQSLSKLSSLSFMDLSHNNLTGRIPSGGQLDTLYCQNPLMYDGNVGLYGPLQKNCTINNQEPKHGDQKGDEQDDEVLTFSFGLGIGFVVGLWMVFCLMLFNKTWRIAYFCLFDKVFDKVYVFVVVTWASWVKQTTTH